MRLVDAATVAACLDDAGLVERLEEVFREGATVPLRHHHTVPVPGQPAATLLLMPAWQTGRHLVVKLATVFPGNGASGLPAVHAQVLALDAASGVPVALLDGTMLTLRRTACASALAARHLARPDAARLLMVGTGKLAPHLIRAHRAVRPGLAAVAIWGRDPAKAAALAQAMRDEGVDAEPATDLAAAVAAADVVSCATLATAPLIRGAWLRPGTHLDLVGAFTPDRREADGEAVARAAVYVDTRAGAMKEGGDLAIPLAEGTIAAGHILGELAELARGSVPGRRDPAAITLFKSVGTAMEDLAAAGLVLERLGPAGDPRQPCSASTAPAR